MNSLSDPTISADEFYRRVLGKQYNPKTTTYRLVSHRKLEDAEREGFEKLATFRDLTIVGKRSK